MSDFSLTTLFVSDGTALASSGSTDALTPKQLGVFLPNYTIATAGNIAAAKYFYIAQGRVENTPTLGSKRSDKIAASKIIDWYKVSAEETVPAEIYTISDFHVQCGEDVNITFRLHSSYIDTVAYNGLTRTVSAPAPCCDCGGLPCEDIAAADIEALVDTLVAKINAPAVDAVEASGGLILSTFLTAQRTGSGASSAILVSTKPLTQYVNNFDPSAYPWEYDRIWMRVFPYTGPANTQDFTVFDRCDIPAVATVTQRSLYPKGSSAEIKQLEKNFYSYQTSQFKHLYRMGGYNAAFESYVTDGTFYDLYYIKAKEYDELNTWSDKVPQDFTVVVALPTGGAAATAFETLLEVALGAAEDKSGLNITTTTTTSTSSTTTTTTTTLIP